MKNTNSWRNYQSIPEQWLHTTMKRSTDINIENTPLGSTVTERETKEHYLTDIQKRVSAAEFSKKVVNVMVPCGTKTYLERMIVLKSLKNVWRMGWLFCSISVVV